MTPRTMFLFIAVGVLAATAVAGWLWLPFLWSFTVSGPIVLLGFADMLQTKRAILRNFPVIGHGRYLLEMIRPEINQYFVESNTSGRPFCRELRSVAYQRAKNVTDTLAFGTEHDVYEPGYTWINHSLRPRNPPEEPFRVLIGGVQCSQPYSSSLLNVSAMSYGALSSNAIRALNLGAKKGEFAHNTGEGGVSAFHQQGGDLTWQIGTGYFGARNPDGTFCPEQFEKQAALPAVKMIEIKLSQGAKPGEGGILPGVKVTRAIAEARGVPIGVSVHSPPAHSAFDSPRGLLQFVARLRDLSGGKPVGFKLCIGKHREFFSICKAMLETGIRPDFITVDGAEGGTGAAPVEFSNVVGTPLIEGLTFVHNALTGAGLRDDIRIIASGHVLTGFSIVHRLALGADLVNSARGMMFSLGCIQAKRCNYNDCPTGVATQKAGLMRGLVVSDKAERVYHFHKNTVHAFAQILGAAGLDEPGQLRRWHIHRRINETTVRTYDEIFKYVDPGCFLNDVPDAYRRAWESASAGTFGNLSDRNTAYSPIAS